MDPIEVRLPIFLQLGTFSGSVSGTARTGLPLHATRSPWQAAKIISQLLARE